MKIEKTGEYRMRNGRKAVVVSLNRHGEQPILGMAANVDDGRDRAFSWFTNGHYLFSMNDHPMDIIAEWTEPKPPQYVPYTWEDREQLRGRWFIDAMGREYMAIRFTQNNGGFWVNNHSGPKFLKECKWLDGTPCGKVVE